MACHGMLWSGSKKADSVLLGVRLQQWEIPKELSAIYRFMDAISQRESWKNTYYTEQYVSDGWHKKLETMGVK